LDPPHRTPWRDLPPHYGSWRTAYSRFRRWQATGIWGRILAHLQEEAGQDDDVALSLHFIDGSVVRAHQHAAGAKGGTPRPRA
jgi:transposase